MSLRQKWTALRTALATEGPRGLVSLARRQWRKLRSWKAKRLQLRRRRAEAEGYPAVVTASQPGIQEKLAGQKTVFSHQLSILIPTWNTQPAYLLALAESLMAQTCPHWEAVFYDGASDRAETLAALRQLQEMDPRLRVVFGERNLRISGNTNEAAACAAGDYLALCDHDDLLSEDAVYEVLRAAESGADLIYSDEDKCSADGKRFFEPNYKPDFAPDTLRSGNYICHLTVLRASLFRQVGGLRSAYDGSQDHDLVLRASECARQIVHIRRVLYHWRMVDTSFSHRQLERCVSAAAAASEDQLRRLGLCGQVTVENLTVRVKWPLPNNAGVALVIPDGAAAPGRWLTRLLQRTDMPIAEVWFCGTQAARCPLPCHAAESPLQAARKSVQPYLLFLQPGLLPEVSGWLSELTGWAARSEIACVGGPVLDSQLRYLTDGMAVCGGEIQQCHHLEFALGPTWQLTDRIPRNVTALHEGYLMIRRDTLNQLNPTALSGMELGLRALAAGYLNVVTPYAAMRCKKTLPLPQPASLQAAATERYWRTEYDISGISPDS